MRFRVVWVVALCMFTAPGCPDSDEVDDAGGKDGITADIPGELDGSGVLWPCSTPGHDCNPHNPCAINPICGKDLKCRPTAMMNCDDGLACTQDICKGMGLCDNRPITGSCALAVKVGGSSGDAGVDAGPSTTEIKCYKSGDRNPNDPCQTCDPATAPRQWSPASGGPCDDGDSCTKDDYCTSGLCKGTSYHKQCADSYSCTKDLCDGKGGCLGNKLRSNYCLISGACYIDGAGHPWGICYFCDVSLSQNIWTPGVTTCNIGNKCYRKGDKHPLNCAECDPSANLKGWTVKGDFCLIQGACKKPADKDTSGCSTCDPKTSKYAWTQLSGQCKIGGKCYQKNAKHAQGCICDPTKSTTAWTATGANCVIGSTNCYATNATEKGGCGKCDPTKSVTSWTKGAGCLAVHDWSKGFGNTSSDQAWKVAVDSKGNVYVAGYFYNSVNFGGGAISSKGGYDAFIASFTPAGVHRWSRGFGNTSSDYAYGVAVDKSDNVYITGSFYSSVNFGGGALTSNGSGDMYIASFTSSGAHRWSKNFGSTSSDYGYAVAADSSGNVHVTGMFYNSVNFGGGAITAVNSGDIFLASFTSTGTHRWSKGFGGSSGDYGYSVAVDKSGNVYITGYIYNSVNFGGGVISTKGYNDIFLASFTSTGTHRWSKGFGNTSYDYGYGVATDSSSNVYIGGCFNSSISFGGSTLFSNGGYDTFLASFTSTGTHRWSKSFGSSSTDYGYGVATDQNDNVYFTGYFYSSANFGGGALVSNGSSDIFIASYTSAGTHRWSRNHGSTSSDYGRGVVVDASSNVYAAGYYYGTVDFGGGPITSKGSNDIYLLKLLQ